MKKIYYLLGILLFLSTEAFADPISIAVGTAAMFGGAWVMGAETAAVFWGALALNAALSGASMLLQGKQKKLGFDDIQRGLQTTGLDPVATRRILRGRVKVGGVVTFMHATDGWTGQPGTKGGKIGNGNQAFLNMIICFAGHEIDSIEKIYFDDYELTIDANGYVVSGTDSLGNTKSYFDSIDRTDLNNGPSDLMTKVVSKVNGNIITKEGWPFGQLFGAGTYTNDWPANTLTANTQTYYKARITKHLGASNQSADSILVATAPDKWSVNHKGEGVAYIYVTLRYSSETFPNGIPNITAIIKGKKIYDSRTSTTEWSENPAMHLRDYLTDSVYGLGVTAAKIDDASFNEAANICDELVNKVNGTTEKRYTCNGVSDSGEEPESIIAGIKSAFNATTFYANGKYYCHAGAWRTPETVGINESECLDGIEIQTNNSRRETFNGVKGQYISPTNNYELSDYPPVVSDAWVTRDEEKKFTELNLPFTNSPSMAQRLAKQLLLKNGQPITINRWRAPISAYRYMVGDIIPVTHTRMGWTNKNFELVDYKFANQDGALVVDMVLRETDVSIYNWATDEESLIDLAPNTSLPSPYNVQPPTGLTVSSGTNQLYVKSDGTVWTRALLTWTPSVTQSVISGGYYNIQTKLSSVDIWETVAQVDGNASQYFMQDVQDGKQYDFRIQSINKLGVPSGWVSYNNHTIIGKTQPPASPTEFELVVQPDGTREYKWTKPEDLDYAGCLIGYSTDTNATFDSMTLLNNGGITSSPYESNQLSAGTYRFGIVAIDTSGNKSAPVYFTKTIGNPRIAGAILNTRPDLNSWPGTYTNCAVEAGSNYIIANSSLSWDGLNLTTWDDFLSWIQGATTPISYTTDAYDLGAIITFTPLVSGIFVGSPTFEVSTSNDNVSWSAYATVNATYTARYFKIKTTIAGTTPAIQILQIIASTSPITDTITNLNTAPIHTSAGVFRVPLTKTFKLITTVDVRPIGVGAGWSVVVMDKNVSTGPLINIYNGSNALADATVDITVTGL